MSGAAVATPARRGLLARVLCKIGLTRVKRDGNLFVPFHVNPWWVVKIHIRHGPRVGMFRNSVDVVKRIPGRWLPRRWGFFFFGIEIGDRGG